MAGMTTIKITTELRDRLAGVADDDYGGATLAEALHGWSPSTRSERRWPLTNGCEPTRQSGRRTSMSPV